MKSTVRGELEKMEISQEIVSQVLGAKQATITIRNRVELVGTITTEPIIHHQTHDENIYQFNLSVPRLRKDLSDDIRVEACERGINPQNYNVGDIVKIIGEFRSVNRREPDGSSHLILSVFVSKISLLKSSEKVNSIRLHGFLCKPPRFRTTPSGRDICDLMLAVNRNYRKCDYIPCVAWGRDASFAKDFKVGDSVFIEGRIQSREYKKRLNDNYDYEVKKICEVSITSIKPMQEGEIVTETYVVENT